MTGVGILGLGSIGATHARAIAALESDLRVVAYTSGSDHDVEALGWPAARRLDTADLLATDNVDLVVIAGPSELHAEQAVAAMEAGKGVVVEKPLATTAADARRVVDTWRRTGAFGAVIAQRRFEPQHRYLKERLVAGDLGRPLLGEVTVHWLRDDAYYRSSPWRANAPGGGSLMNQALHNVDLLVWLMGTPTRVAGFSATLGHQMPAEDTSVAAVRFPDGALGAIMSSTATPPGEAATLALYTSQGSVRIVGDQVEVWSFDSVAPPPATEAIASGASDPRAIGIGGHVAQWRDIDEALRTGRTPALPLDGGLAAVALIDALYESSATGRTVEVTP